MSDSADPGIASSSSDVTQYSTSNDNAITEQNVEKIKDIDDQEPEVKKRKIDVKPPKPDKLEQRLGGILCCAVCLDLPRSAVYQVNIT